jgi:hypothetical protein
VVVSARRVEVRQNLVVNFEKLVPSDPGALLAIVLPHCVVQPLDLGNVALVKPHDQPADIQAVDLPAATSAPVRIPDRLHQLLADISASGRTATKPRRSLARGWAGAAGLVLLVWFYWAGPRPSWLAGWRP